MTVTAFIDCYTGEDKSAVVLQGRATVEEQEAAFRDVLIEYYDLIGNSETKRLSSLQKSISRIAMQVILLPVYMDGWQLFKNKDCKSLMGKCGFYFESNSPENVVKTRFEGFLTSKLLELKNLQSEIETLQQEGGERPSRETFLVNIAEMAKSGYRVIMTDTVEMYAATIKAYREFIKASQSTDKYGKH